MIGKQHILDEIKRIAEANPGRAPSKEKFKSDTGIKKSDRYRRYWIRWGDALLEAGFSPNKMSTAYDEKYLVKKYAELIRKLGHFPVGGEVRLKSTNDETFPGHSVMQFNRFGGKKELVFKII